MFTFRAWGRPLAGGSALGRLPARLLSARARSVAAVPPSFPRKTPGRLRRRPVAVRWRPRRSLGARRIHDVSRAFAQGRKGRLFQATVRRNRGRSGLSGALHPSRRHRQQPADRAPRRRRHVQMEGLSARGGRSPQKEGAPPRPAHRAPLATSRLIALRDGAVTFKWKDYRLEGRDRQKTMTLPVAEFIRRFLIHVLPSGFHRIRHYGLLASGTRARNIARARRLLDASTAQPEAADTRRAETEEPKPLSHPSPCCGGRMIIIERVQRRGT